MAEIEAINPRIMMWARKTAGLSLEEAVVTSSFEGVCFNLGASQRDLGRSRY
jgi:hypothetical protein